MKFQDKCLVMGKWGCLYLCYAYMCGVSEMKAMEDLGKVMLMGILDEECTVLNARKLVYFFTGKDLLVEKSDKMPKGRYACRYEYTDKEGKKHGHWVVCEKGKIVYNPMEVSQSVEKGKVAEDLPFRVIKW